MGNMSQALERLVKEAVKVKTDWKSVLRRFLTERAKIDPSYGRPKRRFLAEDIYLPSLSGEKIGPIAVAIDCSGSIGEVELGAFENEIKAIVQDIRPEEIRIVYFDSEVLRTDVKTSEDEIKLDPIGGGGTAFSPIFQELNKHDVPPVACVVLTDLCCNDFGPCPEYPVLWASTDKEDAEFGEILMLKGNL